VAGRLIGYASEWQVTNFLWGKNGANRTPINAILCPMNKKHAMSKKPCGPLFMGL